jgi:hypothetical protein
MVPRLAAGALLLTVAAAVVACQSSGRYGTPAYAGVATGAAVAGAAAVRAMGGCWAECIAGTHCNRASGLCVPDGRTPAVSSAAAPARSGRPPPMVSSVSYPPGHEYVVPASMSVADAGCEPGHGEGDGGSLACELDAATSSQ